MSETGDYADPDHMANHWWWRPGWRVGTRFYAWHITLGSQHGLHDLIDTYQQALLPFPSLDRIPRQWRHLTLQGLGHVEEVTYEQRDSALAAVAKRLAAVDPFELAFERAAILKEAVALPPSDPDVVAEVRDEIRRGITDAWGFCPDPAEGFRAHVSVAYSNGAAAGKPIRQALDAAAKGSQPATVAEVSLIRMHRDHRMYEWETVATAPLGGPASR